MGEGSVIVIVCVCGGGGGGGGGGEAIIAAEVWFKDRQYGYLEKEGQ